MVANKNNKLHQLISRFHFVLVQFHKGPPNSIWCVECTCGNSFFFGKTRTCVTAHDEKQLF